MPLLSKIKPPFWDHPVEDGQGAMNYRRIWQVNFVVACLVTFAPLAVLAAYCYGTSDSRGMLIWWLIVGCSPVVLAGIFLSTVRQVNRLYELDIHRSEILKEIVYTHRLASVGRLASGVAHEINNPMAVILEKAGLIQDLIARDCEGCDWQRISQLLTGIQENCRRASSITHRLLGFGRHLRLEIEPLDPVQVVREVVGLFKQKSHFKGIAVEINAAEGLPTVPCDRGALEQIVLTMLDNAFEVLDDGGNIQIEVAVTKGDQLKLTFQDDGPGIAKEDLNHLFEPFFSTRQGQHAGLGLSIAYGIVHKLSGEIHVESEPGQGATFTVILPLHPPTGPDHAAEEDIGRWALHARGAGD